MKMAEEKKSGFFSADIMICLSESIAGIENDIKVVGLS
jgi:hypothetical protein